MGEAGAGREADAVAGLELMHVAVEPDLRRALDDIDEFLVETLGVRVRGTAARQEAFVMYANTLQPEVPADRRVRGSSARRRRDNGLPPGRSISAQ